MQVRVARVKGFFLTRLNMNHETIKVGESFKLPDLGTWDKVRDDWIKIEQHAEQSGKAFEVDFKIRKDKPGIWYDFIVTRRK